MCKVTASLCLSLSLSFCESAAASGNAVWVLLQWLGLHSYGSQCTALPVPRGHWMYADHSGPRDWVGACSQGAPGPSCHCRCRVLRQSHLWNLVSCVQSGPLGWLLGHRSRGPRPELGWSAWLGCGREGDDASPKPEGGHSEWRPCVPCVKTQRRGHSTFPSSQACHGLPRQAVAWTYPMYGPRTVAKKRCHRDAFLESFKIRVSGKGSIAQGLEHWSCKIRVLYSKC